MSEEPSLNRTNEEIDEELRKKIALYYHPLFQASLAQWIMQMQTQNYSTLTMHQYSDLNIRIQKSLILDFDYESAATSAFEDWKIDIEREKFDKEYDVQKQSPDQTSPPKDKNYEKETLDYERLSEFFFDLCLSWCQHLDIETFLFFLNGVFLNITSGSHISVSSFKSIDKITVLSIDFFNTLLKHRTECEDKQGEDYKDWYAWNFKRTNEIVKRVETNLVEVFEHKDKRAYDIWVDMPQNSNNNYIDSHIKKLDKQLENMSKMNEKADTMAKTITNIETIKRMSMQGDKSFKGRQKEYNYEGYINRPTSDVPESQMIKTGYKSVFKSTMPSVQEDPPQKFKNQKKFEKSVIGTLPQEYKHAKLIEITETSYLIRNEVRLPILGKQIRMVERQNQKRDTTNLMQNINWKKNTRPMSHSTIKEVEEAKHFISEKENEDLKNNRGHIISNKILESQVKDIEEDSMGRIDVKVPRPGEVEYDRIQDQNQAIKKLIINIDNTIQNYYQNPESFDEGDTVEDVIQKEIEKESLLSENEKKTIEVLVLDYIRNDK